MSLDDLTALTVIFVGFVALVQSIRWIFGRFTGEVGERLASDDSAERSAARAPEPSSPPERASAPQPEPVPSHAPEPTSNAGKKLASAYARFLGMVRQRPAVSVGTALLLGALFGRSASGERDGQGWESRARAARAQWARCANDLEDAKQACQELAAATSLSEPPECW